jgi:hypothetical protein
MVSFEYGACYFSAYDRKRQPKECASRLYGNDAILETHSRWRGIPSNALM